MNKEIFIEKSRKIHGDKYDYSKVVYLNQKEKVCIICPEHGEFWQRPINHLKGYGCKQCQYDILSKKYISNTHDFISKSVKIYGDFYKYDKVNYVKSNVKVCIICPKHGEFYVTPNDFLDGHACPKCGKEKASAAIRDTKESFIAKAKKIHGDKFDYSKVVYSKNDVPVCIICPEHGEFWQTPHSHLNGNGCRECCNKMKGDRSRLTLDEFKNRASIVHNGKYDYSQIVSYNTGKDMVPIVCPKHGVFYQRAEDHLSGHGCKKCYCSTLENELISFFNEKNVVFEYRKTNFCGITELDFYFPQYNAAVECQGIQHFIPVDFHGDGQETAKANYEKQIERDDRKKQLCEKLGVKLLYFSKLNIIYPYKVYENKEELLAEIING